MLNSLLLWGTVAGLVHFVALGILYGNPFVDRMYTQAGRDCPAVRVWTSKLRYLATQFLGTQLEVFALTFAFLWMRPHVDVSGLPGALAVGLLLSAIRVYPRFWNMWIQTNYPNRLLAAEALNGTLGTLLVAVVLEVFAR